MKTCIRNTIIGCTCGAVALSVGLGVMLHKPAAATLTQTQQKQSVNVQDDLKDLMDLQDADKNETAYVIANADGSVQKVIVSNWIKNANKSDKVTDKTDLQDIKNVKANFGYTMNEDKMCVWDAKGQDVYYSGTTKKELPVQVHLTYLLDGKEIAPDKLAGKSGKVTIRFTYTNRQSEKVSIDGKDETIYVPFVMLSGMVLDNDHFRNINVSNGKLINDGDRTIVAGFAMPGMQDNLALSKDKLDIPESVEVTAQVTNFSLVTTVTLATNDVFNHVSTDNLSTVDDLKDQLEQLTDSSKALVNGSSDLYGGMATLLSKSKALIGGVDQLCDATRQLNDGVGKLYDGSDSLNKGMKELNDGLVKLTENSPELTGGAKQVFNTLLGEGTKQLKAASLSVPDLTIENYQATLKGVLSNLEEAKVKAYATAEAKKSVEAEVEKNDALIRAGVTQQVKEGVLAGVLEAQHLTADQYAQLPEQNKAAIDAVVDAQMNSDKSKQTIETNVAEVKKQNVDKGMAGQQVTDAIQAAVDQAAAGRTSVNGLLTQLNSYKEFYDGIIEYTDYVKSAKDGSNKLYAGTNKMTKNMLTLKQSTKKLFDGVLNLNGQMPTLINGVKDLNKYSLQLSDGMKKFDDQGISKISKLADGDLRTLAVRLKATVDVSKHYQTFSGKADDQTGSVKFIYRTAEISAK